MQIGDEKGFFADNYFDLLSGEIEKVNLETEMSEQRLNKVLNIHLTVLLKTDYFC